MGARPAYDDASRRVRRDHPSTTLGLRYAWQGVADAFVAASLTMLPLVPKLVFLVVGPAIDVKLAAMQAGLFGRPFALRFGTVTFAVATVTATLVGLVVLA